jgi:hypothetical protein
MRRGVQAGSRKCFVTVRGSRRRPGRELGTRLRVRGCIDCLRRGAGEGIDQNRPVMGGCGRRIRRRRARHCRQGRASVLGVCEDVAIVMG